MTWTVKLLPAVLALIGFGALACGQPLTTVEQTQTAQAVAASPTATVSVPGTATATAVTGTPAARATPIPGLTDTGYDAPDGSPLYAECVGKDPVSRQQLPLPPLYPTPGPFSPLPSPPSNPNPNPRPPDADLPQFDVLAVTPSDPTGWARVSTPCLGGLGFAVPPHWAAIDQFVVGSYQRSAGAQFESPDGGVKVDITFSYDRDDTFTRFRNSQAGNGSYFLERNVQITVGGASGLVDVSSEVIDSPTRYLAIHYLISPRPDWYMSYVGFFSRPFAQSQIGDFIAMVGSTRFAP